MLSLQQMRIRVGEFLEDSSFTQWPDTLVNQYLNDAAQDFAMRTKCIRKYSTPLTPSTSFGALGTGVTNGTPTITSVNTAGWRVGSPISSLDSVTGALTGVIPGGTFVTAVDPIAGTLTISNNATASVTALLADKPFAFYNMPTDIHELESVWVNGYHVPQSRVGRMPYQWDIEFCNSTAEPSCYLYGDFGFEVIRFWPYPSDAAFPTAKVYYTALPPAMTGNTSTPAGIPKRYNIALVYYAVSMCYRKNFEDADKAKSEEFMALYLDQIRDCSGRIERLLNAEGMGVPYRHL
jgi:hypothetical protein